MTKEQEFEAWWLMNSTRCFCGETSARSIWDAAWTSAKLGQLEKAEAAARAELRKQLTAYAVESFLERDHARARFFLDLADERHALWEETT